VARAATMTSGFPTARWGPRAAPKWPARRMPGASSVNSQSTARARLPIRPLFTSENSTISSERSRKSRRMRGSASGRRNPGLLLKHSASGSSISAPVSPTGLGPQRRSTTA
jgi:hypothetical protein